MESDDDDVVTMTMALFVLDVSDDDGLCAMSGELASLAHTACASNDNGHRQIDLKLKKKKNLTKCEEKRGNR